MALGGGLGFKLGEIFTGQSIEQFGDRNDNRGFKRFAFAFLLSLLIGGFGLFGGFIFQSHFLKSSNPGNPVSPAGQLK
jgi:hypothetical protein